MKNNITKKKIKDYLKETHGDIKPVWQQQINDLCDLKTIIDELKKDISTDGVFTIDRYKQKKINPSLEMLNKILPKYNSMLNDLNLTPKQFSKLKEIDNEDADDFINWLTSHKEDNEDN